MKRLSSFFIAFTLFFSLANTETLATVSDAEVTIAGEVAGEDELAGLNRDADTAHEKLDTIFDLEKIKEDAEYAKIASEIVGDVTAPLLKMIGEKYGKGEIDSATHKFMHALVGCGTGAITGGDCASGATGAVVAELAAELAVHVQTKALADKIKAGGELSPEDFETIANNAKLVGKFASLGVALGLDLNDHSANEAAVNAVENNCGGICVGMAITLLVAYLTVEGDGNSGEGLAKIGRGEDTLSQGVAWAAGETVKLSMEHYPDQTTAVLSGLEKIGEAADVAIEYVDESTGEIVSTTWGAIPETIRDQLVGAGKILTIVIPPAKVGKLKDLAKTGKISDIDFPDGNAPSVDVFNHSLNYHPRIRNRGLEDPRGHNFPYSYDDEILKANPIIQKDGSKLYKVSGTLNGKKGFFEIGVNPDKGLIFHRTFVGDK